jgi:hypothetical protein
MIFAYGWFTRKQTQITEQTTYKGLLELMS